jgi:HNH endonuclease
MTPPDEVSLEDKAKDALYGAAQVFAQSVKADAMLVANWDDGQGGYALRVVRDALVTAGVFIPNATSVANSRKPVPAHTRRAVFERDLYRCVRCGTHLALTLDHKIPVSKGGGNDAENLQTMCMPCNSQKGARA